VLLALLLAPVLLLLVAELAAGMTPEGNAVIFVEDPEMYIVRPANTEGYTWGGERWLRCRINNVNLRGPDVPAEKAAGEVRILCLGDSFTFGSGVEEEQTWPLQLQSLIDPSGAGGVRVMNAGANGWSTNWQGLYLEKRGLDQTRPDIVVLGFNWNDVGDDTDAGPSAVRHFIHAEGSWLSPVARWEWVRRTHLFRWLFTRRVANSPPMTPASRRQMLDIYRSEIDRRLLVHERSLAELLARRPDGTSPSVDFWRSTDTAGWRSVHAALRRMRDLCAERDVAFVVALLPEPSWNGPGRFPAVARLASILNTLRVPWVDLQPDFLRPRVPGGPRERNEALWLPADPVHPNAAGHALFAQRVLKLLRERQLLQ
jgi:lysophospholipase L1-like esterase